MYVCTKNDNDMADLEEKFATIIQTTKLKKKKKTTTTKNRIHPENKASEDHLAYL